MVKTCQCGTRFEGHLNSKWCPDCAKRIKHEQRELSRTQEFRAVDGEGIGRGRSHRYVLLGVGNHQREWPSGISDIGEIFDFLYARFKEEPDRIYSGFYLTYDWNMWLRLLPRERAWRLLTPDGIASRRRRTSPMPFPVRYQGWEFDVLWGKRFKLRPESGGQWMYLNDTGPFFQTSLLSALKTRSEYCEISDEEVSIIEAGKEKRATAELDDDMRLYNRLENKALEALLKDLHRGFTQLGVKLGKTEFHGPGQAAQKWAKKKDGILVSNSAVSDLPPYIYDALVASYYGGIFEITCHGHIGGSSFEYDINSAYPYAAIRLPCMCGRWTPGIPGQFTLQYVTVVGSDSLFGPVPYRTQKRTILRPLYSTGWYWKHELDMAKTAGLVLSLEVHEEIGYQPCNHPNPVAELEQLYLTRLNVGKESALGKAMKLIYNSLYGKFAQSIGNPQIANVAYASLITSFCRTMIMQAISSHPKGTSALLMVATDAVFFSEPHPHLKLSNALGDWEETRKENLTIFKPGMYWDDKARSAVKDGKSPVFKSRGIKASDFKKWIQNVDDVFASWEVEAPHTRPSLPGEKGLVTTVGWPTVTLIPSFSQYSIKSALQWTEGLKDDPAKQASVYKNIAGIVKEDLEITQTCYPSDKRNALHMAEDFDGRIWRSRAWKAGAHWPESTPYDKRFGKPESFLDDYVTTDLPLDNAIAEALSLRG